MTVNTTAANNSQMGGSFQGTALNLTGTVTTFAGPTISSSGYNDSTTASNALFNRPAGITTDGTNLYVAEYSNNKIRKIVISSGVVTTIAGTETFSSPAGITTDGTNLYVSQFNGGKILKIVISSEEVSTFVDSTISGISSPFSITTDNTNLYVADFNNKKI